MNEISLFQSSIWLVLIALNAYFIWKYIHLNKQLKSTQPTTQLTPEKKVEKKKIEPALKNIKIKELSTIINDIKKEEELSKNDCIQRLLYFNKYVLDPLNKGNKVIENDFKFDPNRLILEIKKQLLELYPDLSAQEILLCTFIANGIPTNEIAQLLKLSNGTVRVYKNKLKTKLDVPNGLSLSKYLENNSEIKYKV
jgi:DNA-binding CsgD family transcriptional regulator